jgi:hypothetical protein
MRQYNLKTKWVLTASLFAVLATQSAFQISSLKKPTNSGEYSMSLISSDQINELEAQTGQACTSSECTMTVTDYNGLMDQILNLTKAVEELKAQKQPITPTTTASATPTVAVVTPTNPYPDCEEQTPDETRQERRDRLACIKKEKEKEKKALLTEKFEDRMERIIDRCETDTTCLSEGFSNEVSKYTGKKSLPVPTVAKYFKQMVGAELAKTLFSSDQDQFTNSLASIQSTLQNLPEEYSTLKKSTIDAVKTKSQQQAQAVSQGYQELNQLSQQSNPQAYFAKAEEVKQAHSVLNYYATSYTSAISESINVAHDQSLLDYYKKNYLPDMQKLMSTVYSTPSTTTDQNARVNRDGTQTSTPSANQNNVNNQTRNGRSGAVDNGKITREGNSPFVIPTDRTIRFGQPTDTPNGTRRANRSNQ